MMKPKQRRRGKYFVDGKVQGALLMRVAKYWLLSLVAVACTSFFGWVFVSPGVGVIVGSDGRMSAVLSGLAVSAAAVALMLPIVLFDFVRMTHRFVGPLVRLRHAMRQAAAGERVEPIEFRKNDFWQELADDFNALVRRLEAEAPAQDEARDDAQESTLAAAK